MLNSCLDKDLTKDFIDQLYWCAFWGSSTSLNTGAVYPRSFSYAWLWKSLLQANAVIREESWLLGMSLGAFKFSASNIRIYRNYVRNTNKEHGPCY